MSGELFESMLRERGEAAAGLAEDLAQDGGWDRLGERMASLESTIALGFLHVAKVVDDSAESFAEVGRIREALENIAVEMMRARE